MELNEKDIEFASFKKVLLFGTKSAGKSSFSYLLSTDIFLENIEPTEEGR